MKLEIDFSKFKLPRKGPLARVLIFASGFTGSFFTGLFFNKLVAAAFGVTMTECCGVFAMVWILGTIVSALVAMHDIEDI